MASAYDEYYDVNETKILADFTWINYRVPKNKTELMKSLPLFGSRFYHKSAATFAFNRGLIGWDDCGVGFNCSGALPHDYLRRPLEIIGDAWKRTQDPSLSKRGVNALLGLMATDRSHPSVL